MTKLSEKIKDILFHDIPHPYKILETAIAETLKPGQVIVDAGCGFTAPVLRKFKNKGCRLIGVDLVDFKISDPDLELHKANLGQLPLADNSADIIYARSVIEHVTNPDEVYGEFFRALKPGGLLIFLTANKWDYASIIARIVPNRFHAKIVSAAEGRQEDDVFPTAYKSNTYRAVRRHAHNAGFVIEDFQYLGQYPNYIMFNAFLFLIFSLYERLIMAVPLFKYVRGWIFVTLRKPPETLSTPYQSKQGSR